MADRGAERGAERGAGTERLAAIEALRGLSAGVVVLYHVARHLQRAGDGAAWLDAFRFGHAGVDVFFVISGFVIAHVHGGDVHGGDVGRPGRLGRYAARRFTRVMPTYWVALAVTLLMRAAGGHPWPSPPALLLSATLLPSDLPQVLGVAWTLVHEALFYALFGLLIAAPRIGAALFTLWLAALAAALAGWTADFGQPAMMLSPYNLEFLLGMAVAWRLRRAPVAAPRAALAAGLALLAAAALLEDLGRLDGAAPWARLAYGPAAALTVLGAAAASRRGGLAVPRALAALGTATYSVYLFQFVFIGLAWKLGQEAGLERRLPVAAAFVLLSAAALGGGLATAALVERPLIRLLRGGAPFRVRAAGRG